MDKKFSIGCHRGSEIRPHNFLPLLTETMTVHDSSDLAVAILVCMCLLQYLFAKKSAKDLF